MSFTDRLPDYRARVEACLGDWLPNADTAPANLNEAMRYAVLGGGKRVRPLLVYAAGEALGTPVELLDAPACAVEMVHAYSLIHDDLPAMDDDDLRRGKPTCHKVFGEATAILAGDALQVLAFEVLCDRAHPDLSALSKLRMLATLARASGARGMAGGQALDLAAVGREIDSEGLEQMHQRKTGALLASCLDMALATAEPGAEMSRRLKRFGHAVGLAFQIQDDILDVEGETEALGKAQGADAARGKPTYPSILGLDGARRRAAELESDALDALDGLGEEAQGLRWLATHIVSRGS